MRPGIRIKKMIKFLRKLPLEGGNEIRRKAMTHPKISPETLNRLDKLRFVLPVASLITATIFGAVAVCIYPKTGFSGLDQWGKIIFVVSTAIAVISGLVLMGYRFLLLFFDSRE
jgi:hypothetical protein